MPIVEAVGTCVASFRGPEAKKLALRIQEAMDQEVLKCCAEGLRVNEDATIIRERKMKARQRILDEVKNPII